MMQAGKWSIQVVGDDFKGRISFIFNNSTFLDLSSRHFSFLPKEFKDF
jgi:hypothetical protein